MVNDHPDVLDAAIGLGAIDWCSPLTSDDCAEYRDDAFLQRLGVPSLTKPLSDFWPRLGPQWDALGRAKGGPYVLLEAKGNLSELLSSPSGAGAESATRIQSALDDTARALGASPGTDWSRRFYQYANRLAHGLRRRALARGFQKDGRPARSGGSLAVHAGHAAVAVI